MLPSWFLKLPIDTIFDVTKEIGVDFVLVTALIMQESGGDPLTQRFEKNYKYLYKISDYALANLISYETEENLQKTSFGLMQIMGATARWHGFEDKLSSLYQVRENLVWGCTHVKYLADKYPSLSDVMSAYNQGSPRKDEDGEYLNQDYVNRVVTYYRQIIGYPPNS